MFFFISITLFSNSTYAANEQELKAIYLFRLAYYVSWPNSQNNLNSFNLCLIGKIPFESSLRKFNHNKRIKNKLIYIKNITAINQIKQCHVLFIGISERNRMDKILNSTKKYSILTVSENRGFVEKNGMIQFHGRNQRIRLKINNQIAREQNIFISSELLAIANVIKR